MPPRKTTKIAEKLRRLKLPLLAALLSVGGALAFGVEATSIASKRVAKAKAAKADAAKPQLPRMALRQSLPTTPWHVWTSEKISQIFQSEAELVAFTPEAIEIRDRNSRTATVRLDSLTPEDRDFAQKASRLLPGAVMPASEAAAQIDALVKTGLDKAGLKLNPPTAEEQFVRRIYLDVAGRIPTAAEMQVYLRDESPSKRAKLIDDLLHSDGYRSQMFNWLGDMLRLKDSFGKGVLSYVYQEWIKECLEANTHWDTFVYQLLTAEGRISSTGPVGYLLRDRGMPLDNLSNTLTTFLGANVACAQCHDHPMAEWTQRNFYEMAAFFGDTVWGQALLREQRKRTDRKFSMPLRFLNRLCEVALGQGGQALVGIAEALQLKPAPVHEVEEKTAHATVRLVEIIENAAAAQVASGSPEQQDRELFGVVVAMQHA